MNHIDADIALALGPCGDYEFDLVELSERTLAPERATLVQEHVAQCARCRAYLAELSALDVALATTLPTPELTTDFDARLAQRIAALQHSPARSAALAAENEEYRNLLRALGRALNWRTALNAVAAGAVAGSVAMASLPVVPAILAGLDPRAPMLATYGIAAAALAVGYLQWRKALR